MLTDLLFRKIINDYTKSTITINYNTLHNFLIELDLSDDFHTCNINKVKGDIFEHLTKHYYSSQNKEVYLYSEIPTKLRNELNLSQKDKGIDLIYKLNNKWIGIQCKWRAKQSECIDKNLIAGFIIELKRTKLDYGLVFTNVNQITKYFINEKIKWITNTTLSKIIDKKFIDSIINKQIVNQINKTNPIKELRYYQKEAISKLLECDDKNKQCIMFCGTGKSIVMIEYIKQKKSNKVIILMPSLHLVSQFYKNLTTNHPNQNILCICSQMDKESLTCGEENNNDKANDLLNEFIALDTNVLYTTDQEIINGKLNDKNVIVLCTYQSSSLLKGFTFDLGIFDEAHKTVNSDTFGFCLKDNNCKINERIYFTATPRYYKGNEETCISMANEEIYGKEIYNYNFQQAKNDNNVLDFQIIAYAVPPELEDIITEKYIEKDNLNIKSEVLISALQLAKHIINTKDCTKILTYHNTINNAMEYKKTLNYIFDLYKINASIFAMSGKTNMNTRQNIFNEFEKDKISIICSSKVLNEGVDIPCVDTIMFVDPRTSTVDVTQCVGRGMRLFKDQKECNIIIPIHYDQIDGIHNYTQIIKILIAMNGIDNKLIEYFTIKSPNNRITIKNMDVVDICMNSEVKYDFSEVSKGLSNAIIKSNALNFDYNLALLFKYCGEFKCVPSKMIKYENKGIGQWLHDQKKKLKNTDDELYIKMSVNEYVKKSLDNYLVNKNNNKDKEKLEWNEWFKLLVEYCNENKCVPTGRTKYKNQLIGKWLQCQKNKLESMNNKLYIKMSINEYVKKSLDDYLVDKDNNKDKEKLEWNEWFKLLVEYCNENKCVPTNKTKYKKQLIGSWLQTQKKKLKSADDELYIKMSINKYVKKSLDNYLDPDNKWDEQFELLVEYCNENKCMPLQKTKYKNLKIS